MANFVLRLPATSCRSFSISASSNGAAPGNDIGKSQNGGPVILELPLNKIRRPLLRTRANDPNKVQELMDSIKQIGLQVPAVIGTKHTSGLVSQQSAAKFDVEQKKL
ncbi:sulfiredoxin, chloroplastic/mitochondrial isoform X3 [Hevea brasiliensis]|uniref:sulfiredoxin, chloroplastic/mitochondrial isoform X3 n=1 Tax=Hevea brasiliensis TaxID=3981 RepID=UPI0025FFB983|nr:sulfiredoxin, chloroplastic/mitochondrial isoform X3 [Hevea brasiliensis]